MYILKVVIDEKLFGELYFFNKIRGIKMWFRKIKFVKSNGYERNFIIVGCC